MVEPGIDTPQTVAERMHATQSLLKCQSTLHRGTHHLQTGLPICAIRCSAGNVGPATLQPVKRDAPGACGMLIDHE